MFDIFLTDEAGEQLDILKIDKGLSKLYKAVKKALKFLSQNPRHPGDDLAAGTLSSILKQARLKGGK